MDVLSKENAVHNTYLRSIWLFFLFPCSLHTTLIYFFFAHSLHLRFSITRGLKSLLFSRMLTSIQSIGHVHCPMQIWSRWLRQNGVFEIVNSESLLVNFSAHQLEISFNFLLDVVRDYVRKWLIVYKSQSKKLHQWT